MAMNQAYKANELEVCIMSTYLPTVFGENLFDVFDDFDRDFFRGFGRPEHVLYGKNASRLMKTDVKETDEGYGRWMWICLPATRMKSNWI